LGAGGSSDDAAGDRAEDAGAAADVDGEGEAGEADDLGGAEGAPAADLGGAGATDVAAGGSSAALQALVEMTKAMIGIEPSIELRIEHSDWTRRLAKGCDRSQL